MGGMIKTVGGQPVGQIPKPTADDLRRDAMADYSTSTYRAVDGKDYPSVYHAASNAWIRRAIAAEAECERLRRTKGKK